MAILSLLCLALALVMAPGTAFAKKKRKGGGGGGGGKKRVAIVAPVDAGAASAPLLGKISKALKAHKITPVGGPVVRKAVGKEPPMMDDGWAKAAARLKVDAIIESTMSQMGTKNRLEIVVHNGADGSAVGRATFAGKGPSKKLVASVGAQFWKKLGSAIQGTKKGEGSALPPRDLSPADSDVGRVSKSDGEPIKATEPERAERVAVGDDESKSKNERKKTRGREDSAEEAASKDNDGDHEEESDRKGSGGGDEAEDAGEEESAGSGELRSAEVELDLRALRRVYQYSPPTAARSYQLKAALLVGGQAFWYPIKYAGVFAKGEWTTALKSNAYPTVTRELVLGAQGRYPFSQGEVHLNLAYFQHLFWIQESPDTTDAARNTLTTPNVTYQGLRVGGGGRFYVGDRILVGLDGGYRLVTNPGSGTDQIRSAAYFPTATPFIALDAAGFLGFKIMEFLEARISADYRRYVFGMQSGPMLTVAGIADDYLAVNLGVVGVLGGR